MDIYELLNYVDIDEDEVNIKDISEFEKEKLKILLKRSGDI